MKEIKLSFPYPSTSRHNLSQDVALSLSMGLVVPARVVEVLPGDSHRIGTSYSLISNPLVKPLLQSVRMRYMRFWVPSRIYHIDRRANNTDFDPLNSPVRVGSLQGLSFPAVLKSGAVQFQSDFQQSSLFDYLSLSHVNSRVVSSLAPSEHSYITEAKFNLFNAEPYLGYIDICRNYFADSATNFVAWFVPQLLRSNQELIDSRVVVISPLSELDAYIDQVQNSRSKIVPFDFSKNYSSPGNPAFSPFRLFDSTADQVTTLLSPTQYSDEFRTDFFGLSHAGLCVPMNRPDRLSRLFDTTPLTSQNATVNQNEITISNLSFLAKLQRYLTRRFFGGSRFTDVMYSVFGQKVPHVDSPVLLDVFDREVGSQLIASTNKTATQNPGALGGYMVSNGHLNSGSGRSRKRYTFNEHGYLIDLVYLMPRLFRSFFVPDFYPVDALNFNSELVPMQQGNFIPDFNGIGWQQPAFVNYTLRFVAPSTGSKPALSSRLAFCSEPSWQQFRTLPDVCHGLMNPLLSPPTGENFGPTSAVTNGFNSPLFVFTDRPHGDTVLFVPDGVANAAQQCLADLYYSNPNDFNRVFGLGALTYDNIFVVFRYSHQSKRQVTKRFTLTFN